MKTEHHRLTGHKRMDFARLQKAWDEQNALFDKAIFVSEEEVHNIAVSDSETQFHSRNVDCRRKFAWSMTNSILLIICRVVANNNPHQVLPAAISILLVISLLDLVFWGYKLSLFAIIKHCRKNLSRITWFSMRLKKTENLFPINWIHRLEKRGYNQPLSIPRISTTATCLAILAVSLATNNGLHKIDSGDGLIAKVDEYGIDSQMIQEIEPMDPQKSVSHAEKRKAQSVCRRRQESDIVKSTSGGYNADSVIELTLAEEEMAVTTLAAEVAMDEDSTITTIVQESVRVLCNKEDCLLEKYYGVFCENIFGE